MPRRRHNPNQFTADEAQAATLIYTEGSPACGETSLDKHYYYPKIRIRMCIKEGLEPASRVFGTRIFPATSKRIECPPTLFPPDGKGIWQVEATGKTADEAINRLKPLIPKYWVEKYQRVRADCLAKRPPTRPYKRKK